jgi:hypothetical protein
MAAQTARVVVFEWVADVLAAAAGYLVTEDTVQGSVVRLSGVFGPDFRALVTEGAVAPHPAARIVSPLHMAVYTVPAVGGSPQTGVRDRFFRRMTRDALRLIVAHRAALAVQLGAVAVGSNPPCRSMVLGTLHLMAAQAVITILRCVTQVAFRIDFGLGQFPSMIGVPE